MTLPIITSGTISFSEQPPIGHIHIYRDQFYFLMAYEERQGRPVSVWKTHCCECGAPFEVTGLPKSSSGFSRRCESHKRKGIKVIQRAVHKAALGYHDMVNVPQPMAASPVVTAGAKEEPVSWTVDSPFTIDASKQSASAIKRIIEHCDENNIPYNIINKTNNIEDML